MRAGRLGGQSPLLKLSLGRWVRLVKGVQDWSGGVLIFVRWVEPAKVESCR